MSIDGKMSKSHGDVVTVDSLINKGYNPLSFRYMCLNSHYRKQLIFSMEALNGAENEYNKLKNRIANLSSDGMLVKRPLLELDDTVLIGFKEKEWEIIKK